jgi:hypothetical protein
MPHAIAKVGDTVIAETDHWETVEGNVYVFTTTSYWLCIVLYPVIKTEESNAYASAIHSSHPRRSKTSPSWLRRTLRPIAPGKAMRRTIRWTWMVGFHFQFFSFGCPISQGHHCWQGLRPDTHRCSLVLPTDVWEGKEHQGSYCFL